MPPETKPANDQRSAPANDAKVTRTPGVQLNVIPGKEVVVRASDSKQLYRGKIVGYEPYDFIIAKVRLPQTIRQGLRLGGTLTLKYMHDGTVYGFNAPVQNIISSPASLVFFEYPDVIERLDLRRTSRMACNIDAVLHAENDEEECMVINVSETGCMISARAGSRDLLQRTKVDDALIVAMNLGNEGVLKVAVAVKNITLEKGIINLGCMFLDITKEEMTTIQSYLERISRLTR